MVFLSVGSQMGATQWLALRNSGADFLYCQVTDSIQLEHAESLITKR